MSNPWQAPLPASITKNYPTSIEYDKKLVFDLLEGKKSEAVYESKVNGKVVQIDNPTTDSTTKQKKREEKQRKKLRAKGWSRKKRIESGMYTIPPECQQYHYFEPLHQLWNGYIESLLSKESNAVWGNLLLKADLHGSKLQVVKSKCPTNIGLSGIVAKDTENMFYIITIQNEMKMIPKMNHVFLMDLGKFGKAELYGNHWRHRPTDRITKKMKPKATIDL